MVGLHILEETLKNLLYLGTLDWLIHCLLEKNEVNLTPQQMGNIRPRALQGVYAGLGHK